MKPGRIVVALLASRALIACGAADQPGVATPAQSAPQASRQTAQAVKDPCAYISPEEVAAITTSAVTRTSISGRSCTYHSEPDDGTEVTLYDGDGVRQMEIARKSVALLSGVGQQVSGQGRVGADTGAALTADNSETPELGDEALWNAVLTLSVRQGNNMVEVTPPLMHDPATHSGIPLIPREERRRMAKEIAATILARIANHAG